MEPKASGSENRMQVQEELQNSESKPDLEPNSDDEDYLPPEPTPAPRHPFQCAICDKILCSKYSLISHVATHEDAANRETLRCEICEATFVSRRGLQKHLKTQHVAEREKLPCPTCGRIFKSAEGRKIHMTIQHGAGGPVFKCKQCPMVFARKPHLDLHMTTHGSGLHVCTICGKSYARLKDLSRHETYCGVKELCCPVCGKQLRTEQALENHRKKCRSGGWKMEPSVDEKRGRPKKGDSGGEEGKVRVRRSKYDQFIGLDHLADPSALIEQVEPAKVEPILPKPRVYKRYPCEHCPLKFAGKIALLNHGHRRHWEAFGLSEPAAEKRGRKRSRPVERGPKKIGRPRKIVNYVDAQESPQEEEEIECDDGGEDFDPVESEEFTNEEEVEKVLISETVEPYIVYVEEEREPVDQPDEPTPGAANEDTVKEEIIEFEDYKFDHFESDSVGDDNVDEESFELATADLETEIPEPVKEEVDFLAVEPELKSHVLEEPNIFKELVIKLEKLDYSSLVEPNDDKKTTLPPKYHCEECDKSYQVEYKFKMHNEKMHGIAFASEALNTRTCNHCGQKLKSWSSLVKHVKSFHGERIDDSKFVECPSCHTRFFTEEELKEHVCRRRERKPRKPREPKERRFRCDLCRKAYASLYYLEAHYVVHPEYQNWKCEQCSKLFFKESALKTHQRNQHDPLSKKIRPFKSKYKNPFPRTECEQCGQTFAYRYRLALHRVSEHGSTETPKANRIVPRTTLPRNFHCDQCDKSYHLQTNLAIHKAKIHGVGEAPVKETTAQKHACKHCKKEVTSWSALVYHRKFIHGENIDKMQFVQCPSCRLKFVSDEELAEHLCLKGVIRRTERPFRCDLCDKTYVSKSHLEQHYSVHPEYHKLKCDQCEKGFFNHLWLKKHKRVIHKAKEAYIECGTCKKLFKNLESLKRHQEIHNDNGFHCCDQCGLKFQRLINLRSHVINVHDAQMIPCTICGKVIKGKKNLRVHMRMHNPQHRRYKCSFPACGKTFFVSSALKVHVQSHTKDYRFKCKFCDYGTVIRKQIQQHEQREHNHNRFAEVNDA